MGDQRPGPGVRGAQRLAALLEGGLPVVALGRVLLSAALRLVVGALASVARMLALLLGSGAAVARLPVALLRAGVPGGLAARLALVRAPRRLPGLLAVATLPERGASCCCPPGALRPSDPEAGFWGSCELMKAPSYGACMGTRATAEPNATRLLPPV